MQNFFHGKWQEITARLCLLALAAAFAGMACAAFGRAGEFNRSISLVCLNRELTGMEAAEIRDAERGKETPMDFTAWTQKNNRSVSKPGGTRTVLVDVMEINGSSELLFPYGKILTENDPEGCLLGRETAEALFGSRSASGLTLVYGGQEFVVRGILDSPGELLVVEACGATASFTRIALRPGAGMTAAITAERFLNEHGIAAEQLRYDMLGAEYFGELIPGKWSDFEGWRESLGKWTEDIRLLVAVEKGAAELAYRKELWRAGFFALLGVFFLVAGAGRRAGRAAQTAICDGFMLPF